MKIFSNKFAINILSLSNHDCPKSIIRDISCKINDVCHQYSLVNTVHSWHQIAKFYHWDNIINATKCLRSLSTSLSPKVFLNVMSKPWKYVFYHILTHFRFPIASSRLSLFFTIKICKIHELMNKFYNLNSKLATKIS